MTAPSHIKSIDVSATMSGSSVTNITGDGFNVFYDPGASGNAYLNRETYSLVDGGFLLPDGSSDVKSNIQYVRPGAGLEQNYPNPFAQSTTIVFSIPSRERVSLKIVDLPGCDVATLVDAELSVGRHTCERSVSAQQGATYCVVLTAGNTRQTRAMVLAK